MFIFKKKYFLIIQNIKDINLNNIKKNKKFIIVLRSNKIENNLDGLMRFRRQCKIKRITFFVANDIKLCIRLNSDGIYLSSYNKSFKPLHLKKLNKIIVGSAHNFNEIFEKKKQGCSNIIVSKLFKVDYAPDDKFYGVLKFNHLFYKNEKIIPLGGIKDANLCQVKLIKSEGVAIMTEIKKKPAITNRLF